MEIQDNSGSVLQDELNPGTGRKVRLHQIVQCPGYLFDVGHGAVGGWFSSKRRRLGVGSQANP